MNQTAAITLLLACACGGFAQEAGAPTPPKPKVILARIRTPEGGIMGINYATNDSSLQEDHTGADVPLFAYGASSADVPATVRQTDIFHVMLRHLGLTAPTAPF